MMGRLAGLMVKLKSCRTGESRRPWETGMTGAHERNGGPTAQRSKPKMGISCLTNNERFEIMGEIQDNETSLQILRCNHILHLYRCTSGTVERIANFAMDAASFNELNGQPKPRGNPRKFEVTTAVNKMMENIFPDLKPNSDTYRRRRAVLQFRRSGQRLGILAKCFGDAVLSLLHFDRSGTVVILIMCFVTSRTSARSIL